MSKIATKIGPRRQWCSECLLRAYWRLNADGSPLCGGCLGMMEAKIARVRSRMKRAGYVDGALGGIDHGRVIEDINGL